MYLDPKWLMSDEDKAKLKVGDRVWERKTGRLGHIRKIHKVLNKYYFSITRINGDKFLDNFIVIGGDYLHLSPVQPSTYGLAFPLRLRGIKKNKKYNLYPNHDNYYAKEYIHNPFTWNGWYWLDCNGDVSFEITISCLDRIIFEEVKEE